MGHARPALLALLLTALAGPCAAQYTKQSKRYCSSTGSTTYRSLFLAQNACAASSSCYGVYSRDCPTSSNNWKLCNSASTSVSGTSCVYMCSGKCPSGSSSSSTTRGPTRYPTRAQTLRPTKVGGTAHPTTYDNRIGGGGSDSNNMDAEEAMESILGAAKFLGIGLGVFLVLYGIKSSIFQISQREVVVIERFGRYHTTLTAGLNFIFPYIDQPKCFSNKYTQTSAYGVTTVIDQPNQTKISTQEEVIDFPKQRVISRDNAIIEIDAVLSYKIVHPRTFIYSCLNLPLILSQLLQAQLRNVAGSLELDQMIQDAGSLNTLTGMLDAEAKRFGVQVQFVKVQQVQYSYNPQILSLVKDTENNNKELIIDARSTKQKTVIEAEAQRDTMIKEAEGRAGETLSAARGVAQAIVNKAMGEARNISEIAKALKATGEKNPTRYLLSLKVLEVLKRISSLPNTSVQLMPEQTTFIQAASDISRIAAISK